MFSNYLKIAFRNLIRHKWYAVINILGLALGISCSLMIAVLIRFELGFDRDHQRGDRLYRLVTDEVRADGRVTQSGGSPGAAVDALLKDVSDVEQATIAFMEYEGMFTVREGTREQKFRIEDGVVRAMPEYFSMFSIPFLQGSANGLKEPNTVVLTQSIARRFFGSESPMARIVRLDNTVDLRVVGIVPDPPLQTHLNYTVFRSAVDMRTSGDWDWFFQWNSLTTNSQTYVLLREGATAAGVEKQMMQFEQLFMKDVTNKKILHLQPISQIHLEPAYAGGTGRVVNVDTLAALGVIGLFLILTACVNFVNMATAQATNRAREVGMRKVLGAFPSQIGVQFLSETFLTVLVSLAGSVVIVEIVLPWLVSKIGIPLEFQLFEPVVLGFMTLLAILMTFLSGFYPAIILKSFAPATALKGKVSTGGLQLRRGLTVLQFAISQMLMVGLLVVVMQMDYLSNQDMGMDSEGVLILPVPVREPVRFQTLKNELLSRSEVRSVSFSWSSAISGNVWDTNLRYNEDGEAKLMPTDLKFADDQYLATFGLSLVAGRNVAPSDTVKEFVVNEAFIRKMGIQNPPDAIGTMVKLGQNEFMPIVGVVKDFNIESLHEKIRPALLTTRSNTYSEAGIKIQMSDIQMTLEHLEQAWSSVFPEYVYSYEFLDDRIASFYEQERRVEFLFSVFSAIAIFIGCIGLIGLVSYVVAQKTKEIGVRKVLGASVASILGMFSKEFMLLIVTAFAVAAPVSYIVMNGWLESFAYRIFLGPAVFITSLFLTVFIAALTIGYQAVKAATANPVESLRYE